MALLFQRVDDLMMMIDDDLRAVIVAPLAQITNTNHRLWQFKETETIWWYIIIFDSRIIYAWQVTHQTTPITRVIVFVWIMFWRKLPHCCRVRLWLDSSLILGSSEWHTFRFWITRPFYWILFVCIFLNYNPLRFAPVPFNRGSVEVSH